MPREVVALVSADDVVAAVRVHADRVHDLLRRSGCGATEAAEVCESYAFALIDALVNVPETVGDMAGWWFGRALQLGQRLGDPAAEPADDMPTSVLAGTSGEGQVRGALAGLPEAQRAAVVLRDGYDLPFEAVAVALGTDVETAATTVAAGRLQLLARYDGRSAPTLDAHPGRIPADVGTLARLADGSLPPQRVVGLRRHVAGCPTCEDVTDALAKARRLVAALPVLAMPDEAREAMIQRVAERAAGVLPSVDEVLAAIEDEDEGRPAISPLVVAVAITLALVLGVAVAAVTRLSPTGTHAFGQSPPTAAAESPSFSVSPTPRRHRHGSPSPSASAVSTTPVTTPQQSSTRPTRPAAFASIRLDPTRGPRGTTITVTGSGFPAGASVQIRYSGTLASTSTTATSDANGDFSAQLQANGTLPGSYDVTATGDGQSASATFQQTT